MQPTEIILAVILAVVVVMDIQMPLAVGQFAGSAPGILVVLGIIYFLFTKSNILGVLGILAGFIVVQQSGRLAPIFSAKQGRAAQNVNVGGVTFTPASQFPVTLEETIVRNLVPMVNAPGRGSIATSFGNTHNAGDAF